MCVVEGGGRNFSLPVAIVFCYVLCLFTLSPGSEKLLRKLFPQQQSMGKHKHQSLKDTQSCLLCTYVPYLLVCWKCYHMSYLTPSSRPPFGFCTLGLSCLHLLSLENDRKLPYPMLLAHFSTLIFPFFTLASPFIAPFITVSHIFSSHFSYYAAIHLKLSL